MEESVLSFEDFTIEMGDTQVRKAADFDRMWKVGPGGSICQIPLIHNGIVYFGSCNQNVYAVNTITGELVWSFETDGIILDSCPVEWKGRIFIGSFDYNLYSLDAGSGSLYWKFKTQGEIDIKPFVYDEKVYFGSRDHNVYCVDAETGKEVWRYRTFGEIISSPTVTEGKVYIGSSDYNFYCLDAKTGELLWKFETQGEIHNSNPVLVRNGVAYFGSFDNFLRAVDALTGKLIWKFKTGQYGNVASPVPCKGVLYHICRDGVLYALSEEGEELWRLRKNEIMTIPIIFEDRIYLGCDDRNLYCLDLNGKVLWKFETQGMIWIQPAMWERNICFTSWDCHLYSVNIDTQILSWKFRTAGSPSYVPEPYENFKVEMKIPEADLKDSDVRKVYETETNEEEVGSFYKSRITYQISTQYAEKGKYQVDSQEDEF